MKIPGADQVGLLTIDDVDEKPGEITINTSSIERELLTIDESKNEMIDLFVEVAGSGVAPACEEMLRKNFEALISITNQCRATLRVVPDIHRISVRAVPNI